MRIMAGELEGDALLEADVCVAGAGPAGIGVALELEAAGRSVIVLEADDGPLPGEVEGAYPPLAATRASGFGGTAELWEAELTLRDPQGVRYGPLSAIDFEAREGLHLHGWPFDRQALDPWYARASETCTHGALPSQPVGASVAEGDQSLTDHLFWHGSASTFTQRYRELLYRSRHVRVVAPARATHFELRDGIASQLHAVVAPGRRIRVKAATFVLALGGLENARFLLLNECGNEHDLVGRFFMDHPTAPCRLEVAPAAAKWLDGYDVGKAAEHTTVRTLALSEEMLREKKLLNGGFFVTPAVGRDQRAVMSAQSVIGQIRRHEDRRAIAHDLRNIVTAPDAIAVAAHRRLVRRHPSIEWTFRYSRRAQLLNTLGVGPVSGWTRLRDRPHRFDLHHVMELAPDAERRVTLAETRDKHGQRLPRVRFFVSEQELESLDRTQQHVRAALRRAGVGDLRTTRELTAPGEDLRGHIHPSAHHHLGTTRMHQDPKRGVVNLDSRLHSLKNVYVTGGSVFPTGGYVNPTLTIVALALRLGAHLETLPRSPTEP